MVHLTFNVTYRGFFVITKDDIYTPVLAKMMTKIEIDNKNSLTKNNKTTKIGN